MTIAAFALIESITSEEHQHIELGELKGLSRSHPLIAFRLLFCRFSRVGIPPFMGIYAKGIVLSELVNKGRIWFALIGIIRSVIAAYYYLRVVWFMYFENNNQAIGNKGILNAQSITSIRVSAMLLLIGLYPNPIIQYIRSIISSFLWID
jgi:NADH:ubiquinone oxidoreductase subunit 2 (chain N)